MDWIQAHSASINVLATIVLVSVTAYYAFLTRKILEATEKQSKLNFDPVIGIKIENIGISDVFGPSRRNMGVALELVNVGNEPAIEILVDAELSYRHTNINGYKKFQHDLIQMLCHIFGLGKRIEIVTPVLATRL